MNRDHMLRRLGLAAALLGAQVARAQSALVVFPTDSDDDRTFQVTIVDQTNQTAQCTLPVPGGCHLTLSPGPLQLRANSTQRSLDEILTLPPEGAGLELKYYTPAMGYVGLGLVGLGALYAIEDVLTYSFIKQVAGPQPAGSTVTTANVTLAVVSAVLAGALAIAGAVLAPIGFHRAGPHAKLTPILKAPAPLPPALAPGTAAPPVIWETPPPISGQQ